MTWAAAFGVLFGYLLGSIDFAVVVARLRGVDIYQVGSGNPGASNVLRTLGRGAAATVLTGDLLKGLAAAAVGSALAGEAAGFAAGLAAVAGHCYPVFHRFRGGKGVATAGGVMVWMVPVVAVAVTAVWIVIVRITKVASLGSLAAVLLLVPGAWLAGVRGWGLVWLIAIVLLVLYRHRGNIQRLVGGSERKVVQA